MIKFGADAIRARSDVDKFVFNAAYWALLSTVMQLPLLQLEVAGASRRRGHPPYQLAYRIGVGYDI